MHTVAPKTDTPPATYTVGTLRYNRSTLFVLFGWLLWGDFAFNFFESIFGRFMPLYLNDLKASNTLIGITTGSIAGIVNILFLPNISKWSDRLRTRWGRRIPLLMIMAPITTFSLLGVGFAPEIAEWILGHVPTPVASWFNATILLFSILCSFTISFHFFNMILVNAYNWLVRDVVPEPLMARFLSWFRIVGNIAGILFLWYVFPVMLSHRHETFTGIGIFYLVAFTIMSLNVKEGEYPEPTSQEHKNIMASFASYFRDCMSLPIYRYFFISYVFIIVGGSCAGPFVTLYTRNDLHLTMNEMGKFAAYSGIIGSILLVPAGYLCDKFSSIKATWISLYFIALSPMLAFLFVHTKQSYLAYSLLSCIPWVIWGLGNTALSMSLFPSQFFGQFSAGLNVFGCGALIVGNYLAGQFMDLTAGNYRLIFLWSLLFNVLAIIPFSIVYREWEKNGGAQNYVPPIPKHLL